MAMPPPWQMIPLGSLTTSLLLSLTQDPWSRSFFLKLFALLWLGGLSVWVVWAIWVYPLFFSPLRHLPEPKDNHWLMGQMGKIWKEPSGRPQVRWANEIPNNGLIRYRGLFNQERLLLLSPKALSEVMTSKSYIFQKPKQVREAIGRVLGVGILLAEGNDHKMQRRNLLPAFAFRHIKDMYPVFWSKSREVVQAMTASVNGTSGETEIGEWGSRVALDIIGVAGLGRDFGAIQDPNSPLLQTYKHVFAPSRQAQLLALIRSFLPGFIVESLPLKRNEDVNKAALEIRAVCRSLIQEKKARLANKEQPELDILSVALESQHFSDENLVDQLMTFLAAGHETTATSMSWAVYMLCRYPEMQKRLREEVREHLPSVDSDEEVTSIMIDRMPYLHAFCSEVLRVWGPVPVTTREAVHDTTILDTPVPAGVRIILSPEAVNKTHALWGPDATEFNPDRWMPSADGDSEKDKRAASGGAESNYAFMTFLHGPRSCIGQSFARGEFACLLAAWVGRFEFAMVDEALLDEAKLDIKGGVTQRPANGLHARITVIEGY